MDWMCILCRDHKEIKMFNWFKKKEKGPTIEQRLATLEANLKAEQTAKEEAYKELSVLREKQKDFEDKHNSTEPWIEVVGESIDPVRGIEIRLDWNDAFIQYLKDNGITGRDEETAVQKYIAFLYQDLIDKLEQHSINNSDKITVSDYL